MNWAGVLIVVGGIWVVSQITVGDALGRLGITSSGTSSAAGPNLKNMNPDSSGPSVPVNPGSGDQSQIPGLSIPGGQFGAGGQIP